MGENARDLVGVRSISRLKFIESAKWKAHMSLEGRIQDGAVVFDTPVSLAEGTRVRVEPVSEPAREQDGENSGPSLLEILGDVVGAIADLPSDSAEQHDHYLYGTPKRS